MFLTICSTALGIPQITSLRANTRHRLQSARAMILPRDHTAGTLLPHVLVSGRPAPRARGTPPRQANNPHRTGEPGTTVPRATRTTSPPPRTDAPPALHGGERRRQTATRDRAPVPRPCTHPNSAIVACTRTKNPRAQAGSLTNRVLLQCDRTAARLYTILRSHWQQQRGVRWLRDHSLSGPCEEQTLRMNANDLIIAVEIARSMPLRLEGRFAPEFDRAFPNNFGG
jgi:hypothetical protein